MKNVLKELIPNDSLENKIIEAENKSEDPYLIPVIPQLA